MLTTPTADPLLQVLVEAVREYAIFRLDPSGRVASWNTGANRLKGYAAQEIVGRHFSTFYRDEDVRSGKCELELAEAARVGQIEDEGVRVRKDGSTFWAHVVITALHDEAGALVGFAKVTRDDTNRRRAEEERVRLAQSVAANRAKDEFLATVSHELRTPLTAILGWSRILSTPELADDARSRAVETIERNAQAMSQLVEELLDVSRISSGQMRIEVGPIDLVAVLRAALETVRQAANVKEVHIEAELGDRVVLARGDAGRLQQVFRNLLSNAVKFTPRGGRVTISTVERPSEVVVVVRDTGIGMAPTFLPHAFEPFRQASILRTRGPRAGLGLGLAIVKHLVEQHGGQVEAQSEGLGRGSTFSVHLPAGDTSS